MWKLEIYRVITNIGGWIPAGEYHTISGLCEAIVNTYGLEYRVIDPRGDYHLVEWVESKLDSDYVLPMIGEVCTEWPQKIGDIRG